MGADIKLRVNELRSTQQTVDAALSQLGEVPSPLTVAGNSPIDAAAATLAADINTQTAMVAAELARKRAQTETIFATELARLTAQDAEVAAQISSVI